MKEFCDTILVCHKLGLRDGGLSRSDDIREKEAFFFPCFLDFPGALRTLRKSVKKAEKGWKMPEKADFQEGRLDTP